MDNGNVIEINVANGVSITLMMLAGLFAAGIMMKALRRSGPTVAAPGYSAVSR